MTPSAPLLVSHADGDKIAAAPQTRIAVGDLLPVVRAVRVQIDTDGPVNGMPRVDVEWDGLTTRLDVTGRLAHPLPGRATRLVRVTCDGLSRRAQVRDADTGEVILALSVLVEMRAGEQVLVTVVPFPE